MERDTGIEEVAHALRDAFAKGDADEFMALWHDTDCHVIGTDDEEWWRGRPAVESILRQQFAVVGSVDWDFDDMIGWSAGSVGWMAVRGPMSVGGAPPNCTRLTAVLVSRDDRWSITHWHMSIGIPNQDSIGVSLPTSIDQVAAAVIESRPDLSAQASRSGEVTIVFTDIESSTELAAEMGDEPWFRLLQIHDRVLTSCVERRQGSIVKSIGDGSMLAFATVDEALRFADEARRLLRSEAALTGIRVRMGIHVGDAIHHADDFFGTTVNFAARVASCADGGEILVSERVRHRVSDQSHFEFGTARTFPLKGIQGTHELSALI